MGQEKERLIVQEEQAQARARRDGYVCIYGNEPLLTAEEQARGWCNHCDHNMRKDD